MSTHRPTVGADTGDWGALLNQNFDQIDAKDSSQDVLITAAQSGADASLKKANNLSDLVSVSSARANLGLGTAALLNTTDISTYAIGNTGVTPGAYTNANVTVGADGRITAAANGSGGGGTVTSMSVVTANGVSGSVATATTTPAVTLTLGAITPTSVAATGTVGGSNLSGTNTGDETGATIKTKLGITTLSGSNTGDQTSVTGNAGTATALQTARTINGVSFDGTANITVADSTKVATSTLAALATGVLKNTTTTGALSIAVASDIPTVAAGSAGPLSATDSTTTNARTPTAHASTHASGGGDQITIAESQVTNLTTDLAAKAALAGPTFTGTPAAPTAAVDTNTTQLATTAFVLGQASASGDGLPAHDGVASRGTGTHFARNDHTHPRSWWGPEDHGLIAWSMDPAVAFNSSLITTAGTLYMTRVKVPVATTITNVCFYIITAGASLTSGQCFAALYNSSLSLLSATADQSTAWTSTGYKAMALTSAQAVAAGDYYVGFYYNGTTAPTLARGLSTGIALANLNLATANSRFATSSTSQTTAMPATAATLVASALGWWVAVS